MAVTSIWPITGNVGAVIDYATNPQKTSVANPSELAALHAIDNVVEYTADQMKTENCQLVSGINCIPAIAKDQFMKAKSDFNQFGGRTCFHGYQSFRAGEVDADTAHKIGVALAKELWGDRFEVVVATHLNTDHYHNHFVVNSVSFMDGKKFYNLKSDYQRMREVSDRLCREHKLSVIRDPQDKGKNYSQWSAERNGKPTYQSIVKADIDRAILASTTMRDFYRVMEQMGYRLKLYTKSGSLLKHPVAIPPGSSKGVRLDRLGYDYTLDGITDRILQNMRKQVPFPETARQHKGRYRFRGNFRKYPKTTGLRALYFYYCYKLKIIIKQPASLKKVPAALREDIVKLDRYIAQTRFLGVNHIETAQELTAKKQEIESTLHALTQQRTALRTTLKKAYRHNDSEQIDALKAQIHSTSDAIRKHRKEVSLCDDIALRSGAVKENLEQIIRQQNTQRKENQEHEYNRRRSGTNRSYVPQWR